MAKKIHKIYYAISATSVSLTAPSLVLIIMPLEPLILTLSIFLNVANGRLENYPFVLPSALMLYSPGGSRSPASFLPSHAKRMAPAG